MMMEAGRGREKEGARGTARERERKREINSVAASRVVGLAKMVAELVKRSGRENRLRIIVSKKPRPETFVSTNRWFLSNPIVLRMPKSNIHPRVLLPATPVT
jgi:hypothetical protein